ncbi:class E sortase [Streptomyces spinoverrucosus]|uniref:class E sortase n=1 Tax=Streptomyces spinoverrucosus TaxID=284043 RepID=UPI0018C3E385|nr:class E sortase [Streptomyces spinoverrucosus]MBG0854964.1 class E sortase [Streptomyces spinoverrucosus]
MRGPALRVSVVRVPVVRHTTRRRRARQRRALWAGGEALVTVGIVLLLLVVHQVWWTNRQARQGAEREVAALEEEWGEATTGVQESDPKDAAGSGVPAERPARTQRPAPASAPTRAPLPSHAYAILTIPRLNLRVPVAEGISKPHVLNKGYAGHYPGTAQPGHAGNFALAGHRNTHGEPFRYLDRLGDGDRIVVQTRSAVYTYAVDQTVPQTSARDTGVIRPVPRSLVHPARGYRAPGYYITLTTCTPEYTSKYRLVVWGTLLSMGPR